MESKRLIGQRQVNSYFSFLISLILHVAILCVMSFVFIYEKQDKKIAINITFDNSIQEFIELKDNLPEVVLENSHTDTELLNFQDADSGSVDNDISIELYNDQQTAYADFVPSINVLESIKVSDISSLSEKTGRNNKGFGDGFGKAFEERLASNGAGTGDVQVSIAWNNYNDIDLWVELSNYNETHTINWINRQVGSGVLDIDQNVRPFTNKAVENVFWSYGSAPYCKYSIYVHHYHQWDKIKNTEVWVRILIDGETIFRKVTVSPGNRPLLVHTFTRKPQKNKKTNTKDIGSDDKPLVIVQPTHEQSIPLIQPVPIFQ